MKKTTKLKAFALSVAMAFGMLLPNAAFAQSDDFFRSEDNFNGSRFAADWAITNNGIGQSEAPLGSGLLILSAVGAGYAVARRKRHNGIKAIIIITALIGVTSCRKNLDTVNEAAQHGVYITLNVDGGEKVAVNPTGGGTYATVTWEDGDILYVGNNGAYCGYLAYDASTSKFGGTINPTSADDGDYLHFYFMGNKGTTSEPTSVNITDQTSKYPVISYGRSESLYNTVTTEYSATLYNKCAIGKFTISGVDTDKAITITGMNNTVAVDFSKNGKGAVVNPYTYSKTGSGLIRLHAESNTVRWAILLPQDEVTTATAYAAGYTTESAFTVPAVLANGYYDSGVAVEMASGSPKGVFTINDSGDQVFFAPGNLQYQASTGTWRFAEHQWDYVGDATKGNVYVGEVKCNNALISSSYTGWIDLFGWGTGDDPIKGYDDNSFNSTFNDWGGNCGDPTGNDYHWRTLSTKEWQYLFNSRTNAGDKYGSATVNDIHGIVLLPDNWTLPTGCSFTAGMNGWNNNEYDADAWTLMENNDAVFLPAAGGRYGADVNVVGDGGFYWSSTADDYNDAWLVDFLDDDVYPDFSSYRYLGQSVRLVR